MLTNPATTCNTNLRQSFWSKLLVKALSQGPTLDFASGVMFSRQILSGLHLLQTTFCALELEA